jgi:sucrose-6-phosphate hydrolase SacC (GH32 family)
VTWPSVEAPETKRLAIAWMNNWKYAARDVPTDASDGYNGQNSIVRELRLEHQSGGWYSLLSTPVGALSGHATATTTLPDRTVNGSYVLPWNGRAYELEVDISWVGATNVGVSVGRSPDGLRHTNVGKYGDELYVDRSPSDQNGYSLAPYTRAAAPIDATARSVHLRIFVDTQSVEVFVNAGNTVLSQQVHFADGDTGISFYTDGGPADFAGITIREFGVR